MLCSLLVGYRTVAEDAKDVLPLKCCQSLKTSAEPSVSPCERGTNKEVNKSLHLRGLSDERRASYLPSSSVHRQHNSLTDCLDTKGPNVVFGGRSL